MGRSFVGALAIAALLPTTVAAETGILLKDDAELRERAARTFIVRLSDATPAAEVSARARMAAGRIGGQVRHVYAHSIKGFAIEVEPSVVGQLASAGLGVISIEPDGIVSIEVGAPSDVSITALANTTDNNMETTPWGVTRVGGGLVAGGPALSSNARAFVIDTGIANHPDLNVDRSADFSIDGTTSDGNGHGTHVAGTIAAIKGNDVNGSSTGFGGVIGVAPGATVVPVRVLNDSGSGTISGVIAGVDHVAKLRVACGAATDTAACPPEAWVASMSLGGRANSTLDTAVSNAAATGVRFAVAAGNDNQSATRSSPARVEATNVLTVSASDSTDAIASFSNYGNPPVDFAAPGVSVLSTLPGGYGTYSGTSMAAPHVAGIMLLVPTLTAATTADTFCGFLEKDKDRTVDRIVFSTASNTTLCTNLVGTDTGGGDSGGGGGSTRPGNGNKK